MNLSIRQQFLTVPNLLSMLRLALVPVFLLLLINEKFVLAICTLALASLTDFLDGYFARKWNQITRLGQLLDPAADRLYIFSTLVGLAYVGLIPTWIVIVIRVGLSCFFGSSYASTVTATSTVYPSSRRTWEVISAASASSSTTRIRKSAMGRG